MGMTDVITYRTERIEDLKKLAKEKGVSLSALTSEIIGDYLDHRSITENYKMIGSGRKAVSTAFENLDKQGLEKVIKVAAEEASKSIKTVINEFSLENLLPLMRKWFKYNEFDLKEFDETNTIKLVCKTNMSKNFNEYISKTFVKIANLFDYDGTALYEDGLMQIKILKQRQS